MGIVAKMSVWSVESSPSWDSGTTERVILHAVYSDNPDGENAKWARATPAGTLDLSIDNPAAQGQFEQGKEYLVHIEPAG